MGRLRLSGRQFEASVGASVGPGEDARVEAKVHMKPAAATHVEATFDARRGSAGLGRFKLEAVRAEDARLSVFAEQTRAGLEFRCQFRWRY